MGYHQIYGGMVPSGTQTREMHSLTHRTWTRTAAGADAFHADIRASSTLATHLRSLRSTCWATFLACETWRVTCCHTLENNSGGFFALNASGRAIWSEGRISCNFCFRVYRLAKSFPFDMHCSNNQRKSSQTYLYCFFLHLSASRTTKRNTCTDW